MTGESRTTPEAPGHESFVRVATRREVVVRALRVAAVVGTLLVAINHGDRLLAQSLRPTDYVKILLTYAVPYCVATYAAVCALRGTRTEEQTPGTRN